MTNAPLIEIPAGSGQAGPPNTRNDQVSISAFFGLVHFNSVTASRFMKLKVKIRWVISRTSLQRVSGERIPALALAAFARAEDRKRSLVAGYQAHLAKSFDVGEPLLVVADLVGR